MNRNNFDLNRTKILNPKRDYSMNRNGYRVIPKMKQYQPLNKEYTIFIYM